MIYAGLGTQVRIIQGMERTAIEWPVLVHAARLIGTQQRTSGAMPLRALTLSVHRFPSEALDVEGLHLGDVHVDLAAMVAAFLADGESRYKIVVLVQVVIYQLQLVKVVAWVRGNRCGCLVCSLA
ncbi:hypothetical protein UB44_16620 [Burkholderiaceae bacterium 26]|nr:hypothetical protein UB44_16620 [Burkholderiaceae bacterium 26]